MGKLLFQPCNILLPKTDSYEKWSVIACDVGGFFKDN